jgi:inner membrane protein
MRAPTHYVFSLLIGGLANIPVTQLFTLSLASLVPDIDHPESTVGRVFLPVSKPLNKWGHRTITHSIWALLGITILSFIGFRIGLKNIYWYFIPVSYFSHIFLDFFNVSGVRFIYPSEKKFVSAANKRFRIPVGSWKEWLLFFCIFISSIIIVGRNETFQDQIRGIAKFFWQTYNLSYDEYKKYQGIVTLAEFNYYSDLEKRKLHKKVPILTMDQFSFIYIENGVREKITKVDLADDSIEIVPTTNDIITFDIEGDDLRDLANYVGNSFIVGEIRIKNYVPKLEPNAFTKIFPTDDGSKISLNFAHITDFSELLNIKKDIQEELDILRKQSPRRRLAIVNKDIQRVSKKLDYYTDTGQYARFYTQALSLQKKLSELEKERNDLELTIKQGGNTVDIKIEKLKKASVHYQVRVYSYDLSGLGENFKPQIYMRGVKKPNSVDELSGKKMQGGLKGEFSSILNGY